MIRSEPGPGDSSSLTVEWCQRYFSERLPTVVPEIASVEVRAVSKFPRGVSRETWLVDITVTTDDGRSRPYPLTVRRDQEIGSIDDSPLDFEYGIYQRLSTSDVPVAKALWFGDPADDPAHRLHYVREQVEGHWDIPGFRERGHEYDDLRIAVSKEFLVTMAKVHTLDWRAAGFGDLLKEPGSTTTCAADTLINETARIERAEWDKHPVLTEAFYALMASAPTDAPCVSLCKGTNGLGEEVWRDGSIVALSDWESCSLGDPANDFARNQEMFPTVLAVDGSVRWDLATALKFYEELSGINITEERIRWYHLLYGFAIFRFSQSCMRGMREDHHLIRLAWSSTDVLMWAQVRVAGGTSIFPLPEVARG